MFETQNAASTKHRSPRRFAPLVVSVILTPFAFLLGWTIVSPEGSELFPGVLVFPYSAILFVVLAVLGVQLSVVANFVLLLMIVQFPVYGTIVSLANDRRSALILIFIAHGCALFLLFGLSLFFSVTI